MHTRTGKKRWSHPPLRRTNHPRHGPARKPPAQQAALLDDPGQEYKVYDAMEAEGTLARSHREARLHRQADEEPLVGDARLKRRVVCLTVYRKDAREVVPPETHQDGTHGSGRRDSPAAAAMLANGLTTQGSGVRGRRAKLPSARKHARPPPLQPIVRRPTARPKRCTRTTREGGWHRRAAQLARTGVARPELGRFSGSHETAAPHPRSRCAWSPGARR